MRQCDTLCRALCRPPLSRTLRQSVSRAVPAAYLACALIWGATWFAIRVCIGPDAYPTLAAVALRFVIAFLILLPIALVVTSTLVFVFPLVALATDALFEREISLGPRAYAGTAITLAGLAVALRRR
jgi:drug/metabolite transporter (DMT)-like permease